MRRSFIAVAALIGVSSSLGGQVCQGMASYASGPIRVGASAGFARSVRNYGAQVGAGASSGVFASAEVTHRVLDNNSGGANAVNTAVGYGFDLTPTKTAGFCPFVSAGYDRGPTYQTSVGTGRNAVSTYGFGGSFGGVAGSSGAMDFVPFIGADYIHSSVAASRTGGPSGHFAYDDKYLDIGAGFVFNHRVTVRPSARYAIGASNSGYAYTMAFTVNFGAVGATK